MATATPPPPPHSAAARQPFWLARCTRTIFFFAIALTIAGVYAAFHSTHRRLP